MTIEVEVEFESFYSCYNGSDEEFILEAYKACRNPDIDTLLNSSCNNVQTDVYNWVIDNYEDRLYDYIIAEREEDLENEFKLKDINSLLDFMEEMYYLDQTEQHLVELLERLWDNKGNIMYNDIDEIEDLLIRKKYL